MLRFFPIEICVIVKEQDDVVFRIAHVDGNCFALVRAVENAPSVRVFKGDALHLGGVHVEEQFFSDVGYAFRDGDVSEVNAAVECKIADALHAFFNCNGKEVYAVAERIRTDLFDGGGDGKIGDQLAVHIEVSGIIDRI